MAFALVPRAPGTREATLWVGAFDEAVSGVPVELATPAGAVPVTGWSTFRARRAGRTLHHATVRLTGLEPGRGSRIALRVRGAVAAEARIQTLPARLPSSGDPFNVLLGSCFSEAKHGSDLVGHRFLDLLERERPDLKILCGDQVYLDSPALYFLKNTHTEPELQALFLEHYRRTWTQRDPDGGFARLLEDTPTLFCSDDHELWNNAPYWATVVRDTWMSSGRQRWLRVARDLYRRLQEPAPLPPLEVPPLSFFVLDTRLHRTEERRYFNAKDPELEALETWVQSLRGPGVLTVGQPLFTEPAGFARGRLADFTLSNYEQYERLVRILARADHDLLVLTGDVHFGRIAEARWPWGRRIVEVISSPMALISPLAAGKWREAPPFPPIPVPGVPHATTTTARTRLEDEHFLTLAFSAEGGAVRVAVRAHPIAEDTSLRPGQVIWQGRLY